ncbi:hypothetical protein [Paenibacillus dakarensis]|uniref:hypothetical protein n=1 Tax=Paenibacillus dakarensis TaxID=1527293 RepID=UPI000A647659|nr:hypothetical protein [Paenibacillus dakarensis]
MSTIRKTTNEVSFPNKNVRPSAPLTFLQYNGAPEEYEDIADYLPQDRPLKGARIA